MSNYTALLVEENQLVEKFLKKVRPRLELGVFMEHTNLYNKSVKNIKTGHSMQLLIFNYSLSEMVNYGYYVLIGLSLLITTLWFFNIAHIFFLFFTVGAFVGSSFFISPLFVNYTMRMGLKKEGYVGKFKTLSSRDLVYYLVTLEKKNETEKQVRF